MKQYLFVGLLMVCTGCGGESLPSGPSPLETFDQDRMWVLINAAVNRNKAAECARYFRAADNQASDNPDAAFMSAVFSQVCPESMVKIAAYLEHNGVAGVKPAHVKDLAFWERLEAQDQDISICKKQTYAERAEDALGKAPKQADFPDLIHTLWRRAIRSAQAWSTSASAFRRG